MTKLNEQALHKLKTMTGPEILKGLKDIEIVKQEQPFKVDTLTPDLIRQALIMKKALSIVESEESSMCNHEIGTILCRSRDGFIPHSFNQGGYGVHILKELSEVDQDQYQLNYEYDYKYVKEEHPDVHENSEEFYELVSESMRESESDLCYLEARIMYGGLNEETNKHSATFSLIYRTSDAPYFRYADKYEDFELEYSNAEELLEQVNKVLKVNKYETLNQFLEVA